MSEVLPGSDEGQGEPLGTPEEWKAILGISAVDPNKEKALAENLLLYTLQTQLRNGQYPFKQLNPAKFPADPIYDQKRNVFLYAVAYQFGISAAEAETSLKLRHISEYAPQEVQLFAAIAIGYDINKTQEPGSPEKLEFNGKLNDRLVFLDHTPRLFSAKYNGETRWFEYDAAGTQVTEYPHPIYAVEKGSSAVLNQSWVDLREDQKLAVGMLGEHTDIEKVRESILRRAGMKDTNEAVSIPAFQLLKVNGALSRISTPDGKFVWVYCPPDMFGKNRWWARDHGTEDTLKLLVAQEEKSRKYWHEKVEILKSPKELTVQFVYKGYRSITLSIQCHNGKLSCQQGELRFTPEEEKAMISAVETEALVAWDGLSDNATDAERLSKLARHLINLPRRRTYECLFLADQHDLRLDKATPDHLIFDFSFGGYWYKIVVTKSKKAYTISILPNVRNPSPSKDLFSFKELIGPVFRKALLNAARSRKLTGNLLEDHKAIADAIMQNSFPFWDADFEVIGIK